LRRFFFRVPDDRARTVEFAPLAAAGSTMEAAGMSSISTAKKPQATRKTVFMFGGQGSQYFQMGSALYSKERVFRECMDEMDAIARAVTGRSILATLYGGRSKADPFDDLLLTTPAILMVEYALARTLMAVGIRPDVTLGTSLGSFAAAAVSGLMRMEDALRLAMHKAQVVMSHCEQGAMIAVLADLQRFDLPNLQGEWALAARNASSHFVISAKMAHVPRIESALRTGGHIFQRLPVRYPFHSSWIEPAKEAFLPAARLAPQQEASVPLVCCATSTLRRYLDADFFWQAIRDPIRFEDSVTLLEHDGPCRYIDLSPSGSLATIAKHLVPKPSQSCLTSVITPFGNEAQNLKRLVEAA
jgi:acyl transferase domain-containing protein